MASKSLRRKFVLFGIDALIIAGAQYVALMLAARPGFAQELITGRPWYAALPVVVTLVAVYLAQGYHLEEIVTPWRGLSAMALASTGAAIAVGFLFFLLPGAPEFSARALLVAAIVSTAGLWVARLLYGRALTSGALKEHLLIIGTDASAQALAEVIASRRRSPYQVVGLLAADADASTVPNVVTLNQLPELVGRRRIDTVVLGVGQTSEPRLIRAVTELKRTGIKVRELTDLYEELTGRVPIEYVGELTMLFQNFGQRNELTRALERIVNSGLALVGLVISAPLWPCIVLAQQLNSRGPIFVEHSQRVGLAGAPFRFYKFRSMVPHATQRTDLAAGSAMVTGVNDPRITKVGRLLRKSHLDELPQLLNIIKGDMNFIGPRAEYVENVRRLEQEIPYYHERHRTKPGMTGWAQVRNVYTSASTKDTREKIQYDLYYLKHRSLALDLAIVLRTLKLILKGKGTA